MFLELKWLTHINDVYLCKILSFSDEPHSISTLVLSILTIKRSLFYAYPPVFPIIFLKCFSLFSSMLSGYVSKAKL